MNIIHIRNIMNNTVRQLVKEMTLKIDSELLQTAMRASMKSTPTSNTNEILIHKLIKLYDLMELPEHKKYFYINYDNKELIYVNSDTVASWLKSIQLHDDVLPLKPHIMMKHANEIWRDLKNSEINNND